MTHFSFKVRGTILRSALRRLTLLVQRLNGVDANKMLGDGAFDVIVEPGAPVCGGDVFLASAHPPRLIQREAPQG